MNEWKEVRVGEITSFVSRGITPQYVDDGILVFNQKCIRNGKVDLSLCRMTSNETRIPDTKYVRDGDILINSTGAGTLGRTGIYKGKNLRITVDGHVTIVRTNNYASSLFLSYYLHSIEAQFDCYVHGSTNQTELYAKDIKKIRIKLPDLPIQTRIAEILSAYDDAIENNNRRITLLEKAAQDLYKEWFVRFRFPGYETAEFEHGIPKGWETRRIKSFGRIETGKTPPMINPNNYGTDYIFVKTPDMHGNIFVLSADENLSEIGHLTQPKKLLPKNSIMVSCIGSGGIVSINAYPSHTNQQINSIVLNNDNHLEWLFFTCRYLKSTIELFGATGTTMTNLSKGKFERLKVITPSKMMINLFHEKTYDLLKMIKLLMEQNRILIRQRDLLLPRLMSGKIEV